MSLAQRSTETILNQVVGPLGIAAKDARISTKARDLLLKQAAEVVQYTLPQLLILKHQRGQGGLHLRAMIGRLGDSTTYALVARIDAE